MVITRRGGALASAVAASLLLAGCNGDDTWTPEQNQQACRSSARSRRAPMTASPTTCSPAGLGKTGPRRRRAAGRRFRRRRPRPSLRKLAIYNNYRALVDIAANGGYGALYGPNIDVNGNVTLGEGKIAGIEYLAYADDGTGKQNVTMMVQIPSFFDARSRASSPAPRPARAASTARSAPRANGAEARLRRRLHRQGHRHRRSRSRDRHGQPAERDAQQRGGRRQEFQLHGALDRRRARSVQRRVAEPGRHQARALAAESGKDWGNEHAGRHPVRVLRAERGARGAQQRRHGASATSSRTTRSSSPRRSPTAAAPRSPRPSRTRDRPDRRRRGRRADARARAAGAALTVVRGTTVQPVGASALRLLHARQPVQGCASQSHARRQLVGVAAVRPVPAFATNRARRSRRRAS